MGPDLHGVRGFLLDVGGVLLLPEASRLGPVLREYGGTDDGERIIRAHFAAMTTADDGSAFDWRVYERELLTRSGVPAGRIDAGLAAYADAFGRPSRRRLRGLRGAPPSRRRLRGLRGALNLWQQPIPGAAEALADLHAAGLPVALVSNSDGTVEASLAQTGICQVGPGRGTPVEVILDSQVVGAEKPDPKIFRIALDGLGLEAGEVVHVGDTRFADIAGAQAAGIRPIHIDPYGDCPAPDGHEHARGLAEIVAALP